MKIWHTKESIEGSKRLMPYAIVAIVLLVALVACFMCAAPILQH